MIIPTSQILAVIAAQTLDPGIRNALPRIENSGGKRASIYLLDAVSQWTPANAKDFQQALAGITAPHIDLFINSPGGSVFEGIAIYNFLKTHPAKITAHVVGIAASIASVIAMSGDEIVMADGAMMMIHSPSIGSGGNSEQLRKNATLLDQIEESILDIYIGKTKRPRLELKALLRKDTWFSADEAIAGKFAHRKTAAFKAAAEWKASDFPGLPVNAQAFAADGVFKPTATPTLAKAGFDALSPRDKMRFSTSGGKISAAPGNGVFVPTQIATLTKPNFDALSPAHKMRFSTGGGKIIN